MSTQVILPAVTIDRVDQAIKWIDPDIWGFHLWCTLFSLDSTAIRLVIPSLPLLLPCPTCQVCCSKWIASHPIPNTTNNTREVLYEWLKNLRFHIYTKNLKRSDANRVDQILQISDGKEFHKLDQARFDQRRRYPRFMRQSAAIAIICIAMTLDWLHVEKRNSFLIFFKLTMGGDTTTLAGDTTFANSFSSALDVTNWILQHHYSKLSERNALLSTLNHIHVSVKKLTC